MSADPLLDDLLAKIARYGWAKRYIMSVPEEGLTSFAYTIGLTALGHPEVVVDGLSQASSSALLDDLVGQVRRGARFEAGLISTEFTEDALPIAFIDVVEDDDLTAVEQVYGTIEAVQMVWADPGRLLPWQDGYAGVQYLRGTWPIR